MRSRVSSTTFNVVKRMFQVRELTQPDVEASCADDGLVMGWCRGLVVFLPMPYGDYFWCGCGDGGEAHGFLQSWDFVRGWEEQEAYDEFIPWLERERERESRMYGGQLLDMSWMNMYRVAG